MEALVLIVTMAGWITLLFVVGCALESAAKKLRDRRFRREFRRRDSVIYPEK